MPRLYCHVPQAKEMIENVRTAFTDNLPGLDWMDEKTRAAALDKVIHLH